jgi:hypothetical protein
MGDGDVSLSGQPPNPPASEAMPLPRMTPAQAPRRRRHPQASGLSEGGAAALDQEQVRLERISLLEKAVQPAVTILVRSSQKARLVPRHLAWQRRLAELSDTLRLEDEAVRVGFVLPRRERRREIDRLLRRLETAAKKGRMTGQPLRIDSNALCDLQLVDPTITEDDVCRPSDPAAARDRVATALQLLDDDPDKPMFGVMTGGKDSDTPMCAAIAGICDVLREAGLPLAGARGSVLDRVAVAVAATVGVPAARVRRHIGVVLAVLDGNPEPPITSKRNRRGAT